MSTSQPPLRLRLLAPATALIIAATMIPTGLRHPSFSHIAYTFDPVDIVNNVILYLPLGVALAGTSLRRAFLWGLLLSTAAEALQLGYVERIPSFNDIACNTAGAVLGYLAADYWLRRRGYNLQWLTIPRRWALAAIPFALLGTLMMLVHRPHADFSNWDPSAHLIWGNEATGGRAWDGTISALQIYPYAMTPSQIEQLARSLPASFPDGGLIPLSAISVANGEPMLPTEGERALFDALVKKSQITVLVLARPGNVKQLGPARIVTYSQDPFDRNFTLGQVRDGLTFRLRTPATGPNGTDPALYTGPVLSAEHTSFVAAVYDGRVSHVFVDGKPAAQMDLGLKRPHLPKHVLMLLPGSIPVRVIELGATEMFCSSLLALGLFASGRVPQSLLRRGLIGIAAGVLVGGTIWTVGVTSRGLGMRIVLECVAAGLMIAASLQPEPVEREVA